MPLNLCLLSLTAPESTPVVLQLGFVTVIAMVAGIHFVEAYLHKPAIQSALLQLILLPTAPKAILVVLQLEFVIATIRHPLPGGISAQPCHLLSDPEAPAVNCLRICSWCAAARVCDRNGDRHSLCGGIPTEPCHLFSTPEAASTAGVDHPSSSRTQPGSVGALVSRFAFCL